VKTHVNKKTHIFTPEFGRFVCLIFIWAISNLQDPVKKTEPNKGSIFRVFLAFVPLRLFKFEREKLRRSFEDYANKQKATTSNNESCTLL